MRFAAIVALSLRLLVCPTEAQAAWSGWARCEIWVERAPGYKDREIHDWAVTGVIAATPKLGTWIVNGSGELNNSAQLSRWNISSGVSTGPQTEFQLELASGQVSIKRRSAPSVQGVSGYTFPLPAGTPSHIDAIAPQWGFPNVTGLVGATELKNLAAMDRKTGDSGHGYLRPGGELWEKCIWWFVDGPNPPPAPQSVPRARGVTIAGSTALSFVLTGKYEYFDAQYDQEGTSTFRWLRNGQEIIPRQTSRNYKLESADVGQIISFEVTPVALSGDSPGIPVESSLVGPVTLCLHESVPKPKSVFRRIADFLRASFNRLFPGFGAVVIPCP